MTEKKPKVFVKVDGTPLINDAFDNLLEVAATKFIVVSQKEQILERYGDVYEDVPITYAPQGEQ